MLLGTWLFFLFAAEAEEISRGRNWSGPNGRDPNAALMHCVCENGCSEYVVVLLKNATELPNLYGLCRTGLANK